MKCQICFKGGAELTTACDHHFHHQCFIEQCLQKKDWNLSCHRCQCSLAQCHFDQENGECYVGLSHNNKFTSHYKISRESKIIIETNKQWPQWIRDNGRLQSRKLFPLKYNICVS